METISLLRTVAEELVYAALVRIGLPESDARLTALHLIAAELRGYPGHGLRRVLGVASLSGKLSGATANAILPSAEGVLRLDGCGRLGIPAATDALRNAGQMVTDRGALVVTLTNYLGTTGSLGVLAGPLSDRGIACILMCSSEFAVAPHGSRRAILGTNPICIAFPGSPIAFCADVATAAWSYGAIRDAAQAKLALPKGIVQTADGEPSTDPNDADNGSQLPMAGHKGYALGLAVELLCGPLLGGKAGRDAVHGSDGLLAILIPIGSMREQESVNRDAQALFNEILAGPPINSNSPIRIPGSSAVRVSDPQTEIRISAELLRQIETIGNDSCF